MLAPYVLVLSAVLSLYFDDPGPFTVCAPVFLGGAGAQTTVRHYRRNEGTNFNQQEQDR